MDYAVPIFSRKPDFCISSILLFCIARKAEFGKHGHWMILLVRDRKGLTCMAEDSTRAAKKLAEMSERGSSLNFKVTPEFKKEFKGYAVSQGLTMVELLKEGFSLSKKQRK